MCCELQLWFEHVYKYIPKYFPHEKTIQHKISEYGRHQNKIVLRLHKPISR